MPYAVPSFRPPMLRQPKRALSFYSSTLWLALRKDALLRDLYRCRVCGRIVEGREAHVDHIVPREDGGADTLDNLQTLCREHHGIKTNGEQRRRGLI